LVGLASWSDNEILILERRFISLFHPQLISVRRATLGHDQLQPLAVTEIVRLDSSRGWALDNFEGIARHEGSCFFLINDDNRSPLQSTLLTYMMLLDAEPDSVVISAPADAASTQPDCMAASDDRVDER
jgi:hypothetical protein